MTDDDHDHDPADYDDKNEVEGGDGNVFQYLDLMALKCGVCRQALQRPPRARRGQDHWPRSQSSENEVALFQVSDQQAHPNLHQTISEDSKDTAMIYNDFVVNCLTI